MAGLEPHTQRAELVGEPGDAERRMAEHAGGDAGLLDLGVAIHDAADPAQVDIERPDRPAADDDAGRRPVVGHGVEDLARVLQARIDDLDRRHHVLVARSTSGRRTPGPRSGLPRINASSISTRGTQ